jgi:hypothetical protein
MSSRFLRISGILAHDGRIDLSLRGITNTPPRWSEDTSSPVVAEVFDEHRKLLLRRRIMVDQVCVFPQRGPYLAISDLIPLHEKATHIAIVREGVTLQKFTVAAKAPSVKLRWRPDAQVRGVQTISWEGKHPAGRPVYFIVRYSRDDGRTWLPASLRVRRSEETVNFDALPGGDRCRIKVEAHDGINVTSAESGAFSVAIKGCRPMILAPSEDATYEAGVLVTFRGQGYDLEERRVETSALLWRSSLDGEVGRGTVVDTRELSVGDHTIALVIGERQPIAEARVRVRIREKRAASV